MSGMSLMPGFGDLASSEDRRAAIPSSGDSVHSHRSSNASPLPSGGSVGNKGNVSRPPGLVPSPIGKPGHSYGSSATSQNLTLTPTSSLDGVSDVFSLGRQSSPFHGDGPSISSDYSRRTKEDTSDFPPGLTNLGSFETEDGEHDGLLGLQALRGRAHSSPGPYSSSPPVRGQIGSFEEMRSPSGMSDPRRPRTISRDGGRGQSVGNRPPLSGLSPHTAEHKTFQPPYNRSREPSPPHHPPGYQAGDSGFMSDPSTNRRRATSGDAGRQYQDATSNSYNNLYDMGTPHSIDQLSQKFGQLSSLNTHIHQQRTSSGQQYQPMQHTLPRHQRSTSQPGPLRHAQPDTYYRDDPQHQRRGSEKGAAGNGMYQQHEKEYPDHLYHPHQGRPSPAELQAPPALHDGQRRSSLTAMPSAASAHNYYAQGGHPSIPRRESLDFVPGHRYNEGTPIVASSEEMQMFSGDDRMVGSYGSGRYVSPVQSPSHTHYGHSRHPSDMGNSTLSSSPMSMGSSVMRGVHAQDMYSSFPRGGQHRTTASDDDLSHPLVGEHIEVPAEDHSYTNESAVQRNPRMGYGANPYSRGGSTEVNRNPPNSGALPFPKNVYNVKFKRTQRCFAMGPRLNRDLIVGTYVKVEADRGEDLGIIVGKVSPDKLNPSTRSSFRGGPNEMAPPPGGANASVSADMKRITRLASHEEVALLAMKRDEEAELLKICRAKVRQRGLPMNVVDAEYQFDRHKLTFFFEAEGRVDFRELVRDLFSMYKTRIWMQQLDKSTSATCPTGTEEPEPADMDFGTPIIAPESEYSDFTKHHEASGDDRPN